MYPAAMILADQAVKEHVNSARPDAPVRPERQRRHRFDPVRASAANALHSLADLIQPRRCETAAS
jgi:hypothetical protein